VEASKGEAFNFCGKRREWYRLAAHEGLVQVGYDELNVRDVLGVRSVHDPRFIARLLSLIVGIIVFPLIRCAPRCCQPSLLRTTRKYCPNLGVVFADSREFVTQRASWSLGAFGARRRRICSGLARGGPFHTIPANIVGFDLALPPNSQEGLGGAENTMRSCEYDHDPDDRK
jgi:hypothetical protein